MQREIIKKITNIDFRGVPEAPKRHENPSRRPPKELRSRPQRPREVARDPRPAPGQPRSEFDRAGSSGSHPPGSPYGRIVHRSSPPHNPPTPRSGVRGGLGNLAYETWDGEALKAVLGGGVAGSQRASWAHNGTSLLLLFTALATLWLRRDTFTAPRGALRLLASTFRGPQRSPTAPSECTTGSSSRLHHGPRGLQRQLRSSKLGPEADFSTVCGASHDTFRRHRFLGVGGSGRSPLEYFL